jgi:hypothetical protein
MTATPGKRSRNIPSRFGSIELDITVYPVSGAANAFDQAASDWIAADPCHDGNCRSRLFACER